MIAFFCALGGLKELLIPKKELPFVEIDHNFIKYKNSVNGGVNTIHPSEIELVIMSYNLIEIGQVDEPGIIPIYIEDINLEELASVFKKVSPQAIVKDRHDF